MLIFVIVGFGLLTNYTFSNTNQNIAEGTPFGSGIDINPPKIPEVPPKLPEVPDLLDPDKFDNKDDDDSKDEDDEEEPPIDEDETKEECEEESGYKYEDGECLKVDDESDDDNNDDDNDNDKDDDSDNNNQPQPIPYQPQPIPYQPQPQSQILIPQANTPPTAMNSSVVTTQNRSINIPLEIYDKEGDMLDISIPEAPKFGNLAIKDINTKTLTYTPNSNYIGYDSFIFQGNDRKVSSNNATVSIIIANPPPQPTVPSSTSNNSLTFSTKAGSQSNASQPLVTPSTAPTNTQNLNNLNQAQLVDLIATEISNANNIDKNKLTQAINDLSASTKGGNVIESLKKIAGIVLSDPTGNAAKVIINAALKEQTTSPQTTSPQTTSPQTTSPQTTSSDIQALMKIDIPELKENLVNTKESLVDEEPEYALRGITEIENQLLMLQPPPTFTSVFQNIKNSIARDDLKKAIDDISKVQTQVIKAETEIINAQDK
jgi:hypothetical protein